MQPCSVYLMEVWATEAFTISLGAASAQLARHEHDDLGLLGFFGGLAFPWILTKQEILPFENEMGVRFSRHQRAWIQCSFTTVLT